MTIKFLLKGRGGKLVEVTKNGFLCVQSDRASKSIKRTITDANAVNFVKPKAGKRFIITGIIINTSRAVGVDGALVDIYQTDAEDSTTIATEDDSIVSLDQIKNVTSPLLPLNAETDQGVYINGKATDFTVHVTVFGYFLEV